jgi:hypothetical protein
LQDGVAVNTWASRNNTQGGTSSGAFPTPNPDAIQEFKIETSNYDAGYGRNPGANVNVVAKSGTNNFHGSAFEFFRNTALNADDYFRNATGGSKLTLNPVWWDVWRSDQKGQTVFLRLVSRNRGEERHRRVRIRGRQPVTHPQHAAGELPALGNWGGGVRRNSTGVRCGCGWKYEPAHAVTGYFNRFQSVWDERGVRLQCLPGNAAQAILTRTGVSSRIHVG